MCSLPQRTRLSLLLIALAVANPVTSFFAPTIPLGRTLTSLVVKPDFISLNHFSRHPAGRHQTALQVWWFGGIENKDVEDEDSCELVAVMIERTTPNSRRISGEITVPTPLSDVWAILTDYNRLAIHVPNLVESKVVSSNSRGSHQGDGRYRCRLYQKGAQKIIGFEFGADVTMDMTEVTVSNTAHPNHGSSSSPLQQRKILFQCVDSMFFSKFDGEWSATEVTGEEGDVATQLNYNVLVCPKGPVPVAALEWRIREDVPTNLRAVKRAAMRVGEAGVLAMRSSGRNFQRSAIDLSKKPAVTTMIWGEDETMAKYLSSE